MPQDFTKESAISTIVAIMAKKSIEQRQKYIKFLEESKQYHYNHTIIVSKLGFLKPNRMSATSLEDSNLINLTKYFCNITNSTNQIDYCTSKFVVDDLISAMQNIDNPDTNPGLPQVSGVSDVVGRSANCSIQ